MKRQLALFFAVAATGAAWGEGLDERVVKRLEEALGCVNLTVADMGWDKRPIHDDFRLKCVNETLDEPLGLAARAEQAEREFGGDAEAAAQAGARWLDVKMPRAVKAEEKLLEPMDGAPEEVQAAFWVMWMGWRRAEAARAAAMKGLAYPDRALVDASGARLYVDESEAEWDMTKVLAAAKGVDVAMFFEAQRALAETAREVRTLLASSGGADWKPGSWTQYGKTFVIGGPGPDRLTGDFVIDPGGSDEFTQCVWVVDLGGDDTYRHCGNGLFATPLIMDLAGNDRHLGGNITQGGAAFGASLLLDAGGDDRYEADQCSQGSAFFGVGMLIDLGGQDSYRGARFVQGFGGCRGLGVLSDVDGDDTYYAGGKYKHAPLLPDNYQSLSQGFGFGLRGANTSGGVGILADHAGNDVYSAEVFGQGCSYWFSLGVLVDSAGHDKYTLYHYGQGSGIHLSAAVLMDRAGNDAYASNNGVAQGCGHDWATGLLWDRAGDDYYQGSGLTQGGANANGIGILIEEGGNDSYAGMRPEIQGFSFASRGSIGLGVLLDLGGSDKYTQGGKDNAIWTKSSVGVGMDCEDTK